MYRLQIIAGAVILLGWAASLVDGFATSDYQAADLTTPVMVVFAGFMFGDAVLRRRYNGDERH